MAKRTKLVYQDFRPLRPGEAGYSRTRRSYVSPSTGQIIGVGTFQRRAHKLSSTVPVARAPRTTGGREYYNQRLTTYTDYVNRINRENQLPPITRDQARQQAEFKYAYSILKNPKYKTDKKYDGLYAQALEIIGLRERGWKFDVGDTP